MHEEVNIGRESLRRNCAGPAVGISLRCGPALTQSNVEVLIDQGQLLCQSTHPRQQAVPVFIHPTRMWRPTNSEGDRFEPASPRRRLNADVRCSTGSNTGGAALRTWLGGAMLQCRWMNFLC